MSSSSYAIRRIVSTAQVSSMATYDMILRIYVLYSIWLHPAKNSQLYHNFIVEISELFDLE